MVTASIVIILLPVVAIPGIWLGNKLGRWALEWENDFVSTDYNKIMRNR